MATLSARELEREGTPGGYGTRGTTGTWTTGRDRRSRGLQMSGGGGPMAPPQRGSDRMFPLFIWGGREMGVSGESGG